MFCAKQAAVLVLVYRAGKSYRRSPGTRRRKRRFDLSSRRLTPPAPRRMAESRAPNASGITRRLETIRKTYNEIQIHRRDFPTHQQNRRSLRRGHSGGAFRRRRRDGFRSCQAAVRFALGCYGLTPQQAQARQPIPAAAVSVFNSSNGSGDLTIFQDRQRRFWVLKTHGTVDGKPLPDGESAGDLHPELRGLDDAAVAARHARCAAVQAVWRVSRRQAAQIAIRESLPPTLAQVFL